MRPALPSESCALRGADLLPVSTRALSTVYSTRGPFNCVSSLLCVLDRSPPICFHFPKSGSLQAQYPNECWRLRKRDKDIVWPERSVRARMPGCLAARAAKRDPVIKGTMQQFAMLALVSDASSQLSVYHDHGPLSLPSNRADVDQWVTPRAIWNARPKIERPIAIRRHAG